MTSPSLTAAHGFAPIPGFRKRLPITVVCILLLVVLPGYGVHMQSSAAADGRDVRLSDSLRFLSLELYDNAQLLNSTKIEVDTSSPPEGKDHKMAVLLEKMKQARLDLSRRYPLETAATEPAWNSLAATVKQTHTVDWHSAIRMAKASDDLTKFLVDRAEQRQRISFWTFFAGVLVVALAALLKMRFASRLLRTVQVHHAADERFRVLFEFSSDAHLLFDETGIIDCNNAAIRMLNCSDKSEVLTLHPAVLSPELQPDGSRSLEKCIEMNRIAREQGHHRFEWLHRKTDGTNFPVEVTLTPVVLSGKAAMLAVWHDLTERKKGESELQLLSTVVEESLSGVVITDPDEHIVYFNPAFERLSGYTLEEAKGRHPGKLLHGEGTDTRTRDCLRETIAAREPVSIEILNYNKAGIPYWIEMHITPVFDALGSLTHYVAIENDITRRKQAEDTLRQNEGRMEEAQRIAHLGSWELNPSTGEITWSQEMFRMLGRDPAESVPLYAEQIAAYHPEDRKAIGLHIGRAIEEGIEYELDLRRIDPPGTLRWFHAIGKPVFDLDGKVVRIIGTLMDITERKQLYEQVQLSLKLINEQNAELERQKQEMQRANSQLEALATTDGLTGLKNHRSFQEKLGEECARARRGGAGLSVILLDVDNFKAFNDAYGHPEGDSVLKTVAKILLTVAREMDYVCRYGGEEFVIVLSNTDAPGAVAAAERFREAIETHPWRLRPVTASFGAATLRKGIETTHSLVDAADKALYTSKKAGRNCTIHASDLSSLDASNELAGNASLPYSDLIREMLQLQADTLISASEQIQDTLAQAYDATILSWSRLLDMRDKETEGHSTRVTKLTVRLTRHIGMNAEEVLYARWGALLHDVGKMGVPDSILHKPGPLDEAEWVVMRRHTEIAKEMLLPVSFLRPALDIPYCHHEKWDGTGYPRGLKGNDIPLVARLFAVIDVYDALTSDRPYREAWSKSKTVAHLRSLSGTHFDPRAVKAFLEMLSDKASAKSTEINLMEEGKAETKAVKLVEIDKPDSLAA